MRRGPRARSKHNSPMAGSRPSQRKCSGKPHLTLAGALIGVLISLPHAVHSEGALRPYPVIGDAIPESLTGSKGDAARGRAIVLNRQVGLCLLCHSGPYPDEKFQGTLAPDLNGAG